METGHIVVVVGGAVAGSEAVFQLREKGIRVICIEQNPLPFGKIEDGLPRWHVEQRQKEEEKINERIDHPLVDFIPSTKLGEKISLDQMLKEWNVSAVLLATGAWRDRSLGVPEAEPYVGKGLIYQNPFVYWFNHYHEPGYKGPRYEVPDDILVIGGGLASMDVLKICQIELTQQALRKRGIQEEMLAIEKAGIPALLAKHNLKWEDLGLKGSTLIYRRRVEDMPVASPPDNATPEQEEKTRQLRKKILGNYQSKFLFHLKELHAACGAIIDGGRLVGLKFLRTEVVGKSVKTIPGTETEVRGKLIISSIGSIPEAIPGLPMKGETYIVKSEETGEIDGLARVYALGNAVTGKGNIRVSLMHGRQVSQAVANKLVADSSLKVPTDQAEKIRKSVKELQKAVGYDGKYREWVAKQLALREQT